MTAKYYTRHGLLLKQRQIIAQETKVKSIGREAGAEAGVSCDWHDNFGYEDAKRRLELESTVLSQLREDLVGAQTIAVEEQSERVSIGTTVRITVNGEEKEYTIGAFGETSANNGLLSYTSPLARILMNLRVGDSRTSIVVGKRAEIEIISILPPSSRYFELVEKLFPDPGEATPE